MTGNTDSLAAALTGFRELAQFGSALGSGPRGREFESPISDQIKQRLSKNEGRCFCIKKYLFTPYLYSENT